MGYVSQVSVTAVAYALVESTYVPSFDHLISKLWTSFQQILSLFRSIRAAFIVAWASFSVKASPPKNLRPQGPFCQHLT